MTKFDIPEIRLPQSGDLLFTESGDFWMNACLDWYSDPTELYVVGYKEAADHLIDCVASREGTADSLVFPIVFLYRQYLELRLKELLHAGRRLLDWEEEDTHGHELSSLWPPVRKILEEVWPEGEKQHLVVLDSLFKQFEEVDPGSTTFRYPRDRQGTNSLKLELPRLNLGNLKDVLDGMSTILERASAGIAEYRSNKQDMANEWGAP